MTALALPAGVFHRALQDSAAFGEFVFQSVTTHQALATELGCSGEVISRLLKQLEVQGKLELQRGSIRLLDNAALRELALR